MPIYEFWCESCGATKDKYFSNSNAPRTLPCQQCNEGEAKRVISGAVYHQSEAAKTARLDSRYEKKIDRAMHNTRSADPDRLLRKMKPFD